MWETDFLMLIFVQCHIAKANVISTPHTVTSLADFAATGKLPVLRGYACLSQPYVNALDRRALWCTDCCTYITLFYQITAVETQNEQHTNFTNCITWWVHLQQINFFVVD